MEWWLRYAPTDNEENAAGIEDPLIGECKDVRAPRIHEPRVSIVIINPISLVPEFLYVKKHESPKSRQRTALRAILIAAGILIAFIIVGQVLLEVLGITLPSFSIAGGLGLLAISIMRVLKTAEVTHEEDEAEIAPKDVAIFPLATPYIAGPASILAVVLLTNNDEFGFVEQSQTTVVMLGILALTNLALLGASTIHRFLGDTGADVLSRISGVILAPLSAPLFH